MCTSVPIASHSPLHAREQIGPGTLSLGTIIITISKFSKRFLLFPSEFSLTIFATRYATPLVLLSLRLNVTSKALVTITTTGTCNNSKCGAPKINREGMYLNFNSMCYGAIILLSGAQSQAITLQKSRHVKTPPGMTPDD